MQTGVLRPYQDQIIDQFLGRDSLLVGADMGTGKTPIAIACAEELLGRDEIDTCLIVCPGSLRLQWAQRIAGWTDVTTRLRKVKDRHITVPVDEHCIVVEGTPEKREKIYAKIQELHPEYVIVSYDQVLSEFRRIASIKPGLIVLDEASAIKTFKAQRTKQIKKLTAPYRIALTGTAVENVPEDAFSIMEWVDDSVLGRWDMFEKAFIVRNKFGWVKKYKRLDVMHDKLKPAMARVLITDPEVARYMPQVQEHLWTVALDEKTKALYNELALDLYEELEQGQNTSSTFDVAAYYHGEASESTPNGRIMGRQMAMQQLLNHPLLLFEAQGEYARSVVARGWVDDLETSAKLERLVQEVTGILQEDDSAKVAIFTRFRTMIPFIRNEFLSFGPVVYHGEMTPTEKAAAADAFNTEPDSRVLVSSHAGAYGLDLPVASWLINYDLALSHGRQSQINRRGVRASSTYQVAHVVDMIVMGTIEERTRELVRHKGRVAAAVMDGVGGWVVESTVPSLTETLALSL